jgi:hypothetical protein
MRTLQFRAGLILIGVATITGLGARNAAAAKRHERKASRACTAAYNAAQELERDNHLREAEKSWLACAKATCGAFLKHECTVRHARVGGDIPSVIPVITDAAGAPVADAQVAMDGQLLTSRIDGRAVPVDPGVHEFVFKNGSGQLAQEKVVISQGQRNRLISVSLRPAADTTAHAEVPATAARPPVANPPELKPTALDHNAPAAEESSQAIRGRHSSGSVAPYLLGTMGVASLAGFGLLTYWGRKDNDRLADCSPNCAPASVDHIRKMYLGANIALGVGVAALVGAAWVALSGGSSSKDDTVAQGRYVLQMQPLYQGAAASLGGRF